MKLKPVTTCIRVMFACYYTLKVVARSCRFLCLDPFSALVQLVTQCTLLYTVSLVFSHKSIVVSFILICTSLLGSLRNTTVEYLKHLNFLWTSESAKTLGINFFTKTNIPFHSIVRLPEISYTKIKFRNIFLYMGLKTR